MRRLILITIVIGITATDGLAWSSRASRTEHTIQQLDLAIDTYLLDHPSPPNAADYWTALESADLWIGDSPAPIEDEWGQPLVYKVPGRHGPYDIYSVGANGIDEDGRRDDISNWAGVNRGFYYRRGKTSGRIVVVGSLGLAAAVAGIGFWWRRGITWPLACLIVSAGVPFGYYLLTMAGPPRFPEWTHVAAVGLALSILWGFILAKAISNKPNKAAQ